MTDNEQLKMSMAIEEVLSLMNKIIQDIQGNHPSIPMLNAKMKHLGEYINLMTPYKITSEMVKSLRDETGEGVIAVAKALNKARGDMAKARAYLR